MAGEKGTEGSMKLSVEEIESHVADTETARAGYVAAAAIWEKMWCLQLFDKTPKQVLLREGREQVADDARADDAIPCSHVFDSLDCSRDRHGIDDQRGNG